VQTTRRCGARRSAPPSRTLAGSPAGRVSAFGLPAVLRTAGRRLLLDRSHLTRPKSIQLRTTSFPVYDERRGPLKTPQGVSGTAGRSTRPPTVTRPGERQDALSGHRV